MKKILGNEMDRLKEAGRVRVLCMGRKAQDGIAGIDDNPVKTRHLKARNWGKKKDSEKICEILQKL